ncbi:MAG: DUF3343 domain-containing protein [Blautia sp.]|jgi:hypothetical protein
MRPKKEQLIITFATTSEAMRMEKYCTAHSIQGRLIPLPAEISAGCGLAWKTDPAEQAALIRTLTEDKICWQSMNVLLL